MSTDNEVMIEAIELSKRYEDGLLALDKLSLEVRKGEIYAMLGGNGAGKTTAIHLFLNFIEPTSGEARIAGIVSHRDPLGAKERVAFVSENVSLYPNFTAIQNLDYFTRLGGHEERRARPLRLAEHHDQPLPLVIPPRRDGDVAVGAREVAVRHSPDARRAPVEREPPVRPGHANAPL